jgi:hypothetical protein
VTRDRSGNISSLNANPWRCQMRESTKCVSATNQNVDRPVDPNVPHILSRMIDLSAGCVTRKHFGGGIIG